MSAGGITFELRQASVRYPATTALAPTSLRIDAGEALALVGPSGAGKTTLLRLLCAGHRPTAGRVEVDGTDLATLGRRELRAARAAVGFVHQDLGLVPNLRVCQNVAAGRLGGWSLARSLREVLWPSRAVVDEIHALLARTGIAEKLFERTDRLSGGQLQRVAIARALFQRPRAILADEPTSSVDPARARDTIALLVEICREDGTTLCISSHDVELARASFPRLVGLRGGHVAFDRATERVGDRELATLFDLSRAEMLLDGA